MATTTSKTGVHGLTPALLLGGHYVHTTRTGRKVAVPTRTRRLLKARGL